MGLFGGSSKTGEYGVVLDIGSGSVLAAIVHSDETKEQPVVIWSKREHVPLRKNSSVQENAKAVMSALVNAAMMLDAEGRSVLSQYDSGAKLTQLQCGISAPWSYTVTKSINYKKDKPFVISDDLIEQLVETAEEHIAQELKQHEVITDLGLTIVNRSTMNISANGYFVERPQGQSAEEVVLSHASVVTQQYLLDALKELQEKLFPHTELKIYSYMLMLYRVLQDINQPHTDYSIVDVTFEATEIGVVRNGALQYCTHTSKGLYTLARLLAERTDGEVHELYQQLRSGNIGHSLNEDTHAGREADRVIQDYIMKITDLFHETGDGLAIPKHIFVHTANGSQPFATEAVTTAASRVLKSHPLVQSTISSVLSANSGEIVETTKNFDEALTVSALFFHTHGDK